MKTLSNSKSETEMRGLAHKIKASGITVGFAIGFTKW
jgi:hypothetical protein